MGYYRNERYRRVNPNKRIVDLMLHLQAAQDEFMAGNTDAMIEIEKQVVPQKSIVLRESQVKAEVFNKYNYAVYDRGDRSGNACFTIKNPNHRLYHKDVIAVRAPIYNEDKNAVPQYTMVYVDRCTINSINNQQIRVDKAGYARIGNKFLHRVAVNYKYVHHKNGIRTDDYLDNLEASDAFLNTQDRLGTPFGLAGIKRNPNLDPTVNKKSTKLLSYTTNKITYGSYHEYIIAAINKYLVDAQVYGRTYHDLDDATLRRIAMYSIKYTGLNANYLYELYQLFLRIVDCKDNVRAMLGELYGWVPYFENHSKQGILMIDDGAFMRSYGYQNMFFVDSILKDRNGFRRTTFDDACNFVYNRKGRIVYRDSKGLTAEECAQLN